VGRAPSPAVFEVDFDFSNLGLRLGDGSVGRTLLSDAFEFDFDLLPVE
jgi:hypothetical protein